MMQSAYTELTNLQDCVVVVDARGIEMCKLLMENAPVLSCEMASSLAVAAASSCASTTGPEDCMTTEYGTVADPASEDACTAANPGTGGRALSVQNPATGVTTCLGGIAIAGKSSKATREAAADTAANIIFASQ